MNFSNKSELAVRALIAARQVADFASAEGAAFTAPPRRPMTSHMGAILADAVLQAGVNYSTVVLPRVAAILHVFPDLDGVSTLVKLIDQQRTGEFLSWDHPEKIRRFNSLVTFLNVQQVETAEHLRQRLSVEGFGEELQTIRGVGPKTVDYLACLVGVDSIAVDRHVRAFARMAGVDAEDYKFLRTVFCYAADLLSLSRRDFDAWIWRTQSMSSTQVQLALCPC